MDQTEQDKRPSDGQITLAVEDILRRHGVPERQWASNLCIALGQTQSQVRRRLANETPWSIEEIKRLAAHFGEPVFRLLFGLVDGASRPAVMVRDGTSIRCWIWPESERIRAPLGPLVAIPQPDSKPWLVTSVSEIGVEGGFEIKRLLVEQGPPRRIAVLCEDAEPIVAYLRSKGLDARHYLSDGRLKADLSSVGFDAYVLDWSGSASKVRRLIPTIREKNPSGPLILLPDSFEPGSQDEAHLEADAATYRAILFNKPTRPVNVFTAIERGLEQAQTAPEKPA